MTDEQGEAMFQEWWRNGLTHWADLEKRLHAAGLLVTDLHKRALDACERCASSGAREHVAVNDCLLIGRESLAAKEGKE
jgi:hypothetical protein